MKPAALKLLVSFVLVAGLMLMVGTAAAAPGSTSLNARAVRFQELQNVIHVLVFDDAGRPGQAPVVVSAGDPVILVFEWDSETTADLSDTYLNNPAHTITLSVDGAPPFSVKSSYQTPFVAATSSGPRWSWDHDFDGPGDGDGDGIGDWNGAVMFFRHAVTGLSIGTHTLVLVVEDNGAFITEVITVQVVP